jgi:hypothetical protein
MANEKKENARLGEGIYHPSARPMKVYLDEDGCMWLCDKEFDTRKGFVQEGCWRCRDLAFTRND